MAEGRAQCGPGLHLSQPGGNALGKHIGYAIAPGKTLPVLDDLRCWEYDSVPSPYTPGSRIISDPQLYSLKHRGNLGRLAPMVSQIVVGSLSGVSAWTDVSRYAAGNYGVPRPNATDIAAIGDHVRFLCRRIGRSVLYCRVMRWGMRYGNRLGLHRLAEAGETIAAYTAEESPSFREQSASETEGGVIRRKVQQKVDRRCPWGTRQG